MRRAWLPLGVDVGSTRLRLVALSAEVPPRLERAVVRDLPPPVPGAGSNDDAEIVAAALREAALELGTGERRCVAALAEPDALLRRTALPRMSPLERMRAATFEATRFVDAPLAEWTVRAAAGPDEGEVIIGIARTEALRRRVRSLRGAGLRPIAVDHASLAWRRAVPHADAVLDVGWRRSTLTLFAEPLADVRTFSLGGEHVTERIARSLGCDRDAAEERKRTVGEGGAAGDERERFVDAVAEALVELRSAGRDVRTLVLAGNGARLDGLAAALERVTAIRILPSAFPPGLAAAYPADVLRACAPDWLFAYGLALWDAR